MTASSYLSAINLDPEQGSPTPPDRPVDANRARPAPDQDGPEMPLDYSAANLETAGPA